jgi:hypothetical protein
MRGHIFEALGRREEAIADFRRALAKAPDLQGSKDALKRLGASPWIPVDGQKIDPRSNSLFGRENSLFGKNNSLFHLLGNFAASI